MESRIVETIGRIAVEECLAAPCSSPDVVEDRRAAVEAAGLDWLAMLRWIAENRQRIVELAQEAWTLIQTFPRPKTVATEEPRPQAIDAAAIVTLITALAPVIEKLLAAIRQRKNIQPGPQPGPNVQPGPQPGPSGDVV